MKLLFTIAITLFTTSTMADSFMDRYQAIRGNSYPQIQPVQPIRPIQPIIPNNNLLTPSRMAPQFGSSTVRCRPDYMGGIICN